MINLLPDEVKTDMSAARMNVVLLRYNIVVLASIAVLALFCLTFFLILKNSQTVAVSTKNDNSGKAASYANVRKEAEEYRNNLTVAKSIFASAITYTEILNSITKLIPSGVVLDSLNISDSTFGQQNSFSAHAKSYVAATKLKENFQSSKLFSNVYFQSLTASNSPSDSSYPVSVVISAKLNRIES